MNSGQNLENLKKFVRATNYLTVSQIFLKNNFLLDDNLSHEDIKPRLLGHWGSCSGVNTVYAHLLVAQKNLDFASSPLKTAFMLGPGHAFPALQANLFLEGTLSEFDKNTPRNAKGLAHISRKFSWPKGYPSHASPYTPNVILEGGELGYSLATAFGAVLDNPDLILATLIGDGEAETGAIASAWHLSKLIDPVKNGVVLPILHLNGYKISGPTIFGSMSDFELIQYFHGLGYNPKIIDEYSAEDVDADFAKTLREVYRQISKIKLGNFGRSEFVRLPMIIFRNKKGGSGVAELNGEKIEGNSSAHQVPLPKAGSDENELKMLQDWLESYNFEELFDREKGEFGAWLEEFLPARGSRLGMNKFLEGWNNFRPLEIPKMADSQGEKSLAMNAIGEFLRDIFKQNPDNFRFFSPDETYSNKLNAIFEVTSRSWQRDIKQWEKDLSRDGRVLEILNETSLQGLLQGYILSGRHGVMTSYEAFMPIVSSMMDQYAKFLIQSRDVLWRGDIASLNYILTSTGWRQDHNGFSHQNPSFLDEVLRRHNGIGQIFLPADDNQAIVSMKNMLESRNNINVLIASKTPEPRFFSLEQAEKIIERGGIFVYDLWRGEEFDAWRAGGSIDEPDVILAASGDYVFKEVVAAAQILNQKMTGEKKKKIRIAYLSVMNSGGFGTFKNTLSKRNFINIFGEKTPVFLSFHGYPQSVKSLLFDYENPARFTVNGYEEKGSTTTPFDMLARNRVSRYDVAERVAEHFNHKKLADQFAQKRQEILDFAEENSVDPSEIENFNYLRFY